MPSPQLTIWQAADNVFGLPNPFTGDITDEEKAKQKAVAEKATEERDTHRTARDKVRQLFGG
jgi:hypothetical protein